MLVYVCYIEHKYVVVLLLLLFFVCCFVSGFGRWGWDRVSSCNCAISLWMGCIDSTLHVCVCVYVMYVCVCVCAPVSASG